MLRKKPKKTKSHDSYYGLRSRHRYRHHRTKLAPSFGGAWRPWKQAHAKPVPAPPPISQQRACGPAPGPALPFGSARRPQTHAELFQNKFARRVAKRARVIFEIMTLRRVISEHSNLREGSAFTPKPHRCLHLHTQDLLVLSFSCVARYWRASSNTSGGTRSSFFVISRRK